MTTGNREAVYVLASYNGDDAGMVMRDDGQSDEDIETAAMAMYPGCCVMSITRTSWKEADRLLARHCGGS